MNFSFTDDIQKDLKLGTIKEVNSLLSESQNNTVPVVKRVYDAMQNEKKWGKRDVENAEYAVYQTFSDILDNVMRNLEKVFSSIHFSYLPTPEKLQTATTETMYLFF